MRNAFAVVFVVSALVFSGACKGKGPTGPGQVENPNSYPMGTVVPNQPFRADAVYPPLTLVETGESIKPGSPTNLTVKMGRLIQLSCGPSAPAGRFCVSVENTTARLDESTPHSPAGGASLTMSTSPDCQPPGNSITNLNLPRGAELPFEMNLNGGTKVLGSEPCGVYFTGYYFLQGDRKREIKAEGMIRLEKN